MSIDTLTGDDFMRFDAPTHRVALGLYDEAVDKTLALVQAALPPAERDEQLDRLTSLLTVRKVHRVRLAELEDDELPAPRPASQQYFDTELDQLPA